MDQDNTLDAKKKLVISVEDTNNIKNFYKHFNIPMTKALEDSILAFEASQTVETQEQVKLAVCESIVTTKHEAFADEMVAGIVKESTRITYHNKFDSELEKVLTEKEEESK